MEEKQFDSKEFLQIRELVVSSNQKGLQALLGFTPRNSRFHKTKDGGLESKIYPSTPKASFLLKWLHCLLSGKAGERCVGSDKEYILNADDTLQALLMIDPQYITPWNALDEFSSALGNNNNSVTIVSILQCVSSIEEFLLKAKFPFTLSRSHTDQTLVPQNIRETMVQFAETLTNHLLSPTNGAIDNTLKQSNRNHHEARAPVVVKLVLELLCTVLSVCRGWCSDLFHDMVPVVHLRRPSPPRIKIWLQLAQKSKPLLTFTQVEKIGNVLLDLLCDGSTEVLPAQDIPLIISIVVDIASPVSSTILVSGGESFQDVYKLWRRIAFVALYRTLARSDQQSYLQSENYLKEGVKKWGVTSVKIWISEIIDACAESTTTPDESTIPMWFAFYLLSLCTEVLRDEDISSKLGLLDEVIGHDVDPSGEMVNCMAEQEHRSILDFLFGSQRNSLSDEEFDRISCRNGGLFYLESDSAKRIEWLSRCGRLILGSIYLRECDASDESLEKNHHSTAVHRAIRIISMVDQILTKCADECLLQASISTIIVKTVAYFEVPELQIVLEGKIEKEVSTTSRLQNTYFSTLRLILNSALRMDNNPEMTGRWIAIIDRSLPFSHPTYLSRILTIPPLARSSILDMSKKMLSPLYSSWGCYEYEIETSEQTSEPDIQQRIVGGMRGLLELVRSDQWGKTEMIAWSILSDSMVNDVPPLPVRSRRWLFQTLSTYMADGIFGLKTVNHLLRASVIRMSSFFVDYEMESKILVSSNRAGEIGSLHRLISMLLRYLASFDGYSESRQILLAQGRETFLRAVLLYKKGKFVGNQFHYGISKQYNSIQSDEPASFILCWLLFLKINFYLLDNFMSTDSKNKTSGHLESSSMEHEVSLLQLLHRIKEIEDQELQVEYGANSGRKNSLPTWPHSHTMNDFGSLEPITTGSTTSFPILDLLLEFLFLVPLPARESLNIDDPLTWKVVTATGYLMIKERSYSKSSECILSIETIKATAGPFISISSLLVRGALDLDCGLSVLDDLLGPIFSYCRTLHLALQATDAPDCGRIIGNLWNLYQAVASEKASVKIIKYMESHMSENHAPSTEHDHYQFSLRSIYTEDDIDKTVRQLRFSCLQPFLSCMQSLSNSERIDTTLPRSLVCGIIGALATDLRAGLDGKSGGIPRQLYIMYCMSIEECGSLLFHERQSSSDCSLFLLFKDITSTLAHILVAVPLRDAVLFRTTFILAVAVFPSMCRDLIRNGLCGFDSESKIVGIMPLADSILFEEVFEDCIDILVRWSSLRDPRLIPWLDIAGPDHSSIRHDMPLSRTHHLGISNSFDNTQDSDGIIQRSTKDRRKSNSHHGNIPRKIRLFSKELWSWALSCSLLGLEHKWLESERTIQISDSTGNRDGSHVSAIEWKEFFGARKTELQNSLLQINRFFRASQGLHQLDERGNQVVLDVMAMNLPSAPRLRLCCFVECISRILNHSIRCFTSFLCGETKTSDRHISVIESMCCLSAWLSLEEEPEKDFSVGLFKWLEIASRKHPPGETTSFKKCDKAELFTRLSVVSEQVHGLYLVLKELRKSLESRGVGFKNSFQSELIGSFFDGNDAPKEMLRHISLKLHSLEAVIPGELKVKSFPDFPSSRKVGINPESAGKKRVRSEKRRATPKSKKKKLQSKSRNKVVDMFMNLDKDTNSPRRHRTRDVYADLEDFLVEG